MASDNSIPKTTNDEIKSLQAFFEMLISDDAVMLDEIINLRKTLGCIAEKLIDVDRQQWETTVELYALGRRNFLRYCKIITAIAVTSTVIGTAGLIVAVKGYAK